MIIKRVDFPEPEAPTTPTASPLAMVRSTPRRIWTRAAPRPRLRSTPRMATAGRDIVAGILGAGRSSYGRLGADVQLAADRRGTGSDLQGLAAPFSLWEKVSPRATDEGASAAASKPRLRAAPSSGPLGHLLPQAGEGRGRLLLIALCCLLALLFAAPTAAARTVKITALGDSLTAGYGVAAGKSFADQLQAALRAKGHDVVVVNAGVSGDTAADGLARYDWSTPPDTDALIVELGANDMLRGLKPEATKAALAEILDKAKAANIPVLIAGMRAAPNLGPDYGKAFDAIFPDLARSDGATLYPFFLDGVAADPKLNQPDGLHPTAAGVEVIVGRILPSVEALLQRVKP